MSFIYQSNQPAPQSVLRALNPSPLPHPQDVPRPSYLIPKGNNSLNRLFNKQLNTGKMGVYSTLTNNVKH